MLWTLLQQNCFLGLCGGWGIFDYPNLIFAGELNFTLSDAEIWGGKARIDHMAHFFTHILDSTNMVDLAPHTPGPTWRNGCVGHDGVSKRLDIFFTSLHLIPILNHYKSWIQPSEILAHYLVFLGWNFQPSYHLYPFKFNRAWLMEKYFYELVNYS